jgi:hypothetical protein
VDLASPIGIGEVRGVELGDVVSGGEGAIAAGLQDDGDTASGRWYFEAAATAEGDAQWIRGEYDERYTEVDGEWRFADVQASFNYVADCEEGWAEASPVDRWGLLTQRASSAGMQRLVERTVTDIFDEVAADHEGTAIRFQGTDHSFEELRTAGREVADGLAALGHEKGDPGAVWLPNRPEWFEAYLGFAGVGAPVVTVNTRYRTHELEYMLEDSGATTLVLQGSLLDHDFLVMLREVCPSVDEADTGTSARRRTCPSSGSWSWTATARRTSLAGPTGTRRCAIADASRAAPRTRSRSPTTIPPRSSTPAAPPPSPRASSTITGAPSPTRSRWSSGWASPRPTSLWA